MPKENLLKLFSLSEGGAKWVKNNTIVMDSQNTHLPKKTQDIIVTLPRRD